MRAAAQAIELVGGNGYTEDWPTARLFRDAMVLPVWEGPVNIQALELLRVTTANMVPAVFFPCTACHSLKQLTQER